MVIRVNDIWGPLARSVPSKPLSDLPQAHQEILRRQVAIVRDRLWAENAHAMNQMRHMYAGGDEARVMQVLIGEYIQDDGIVEEWRAEQATQPKKTGTVTR